MSGDEIEAEANSMPAEVPELASPANEAAAELSQAAQRFQSCRWRKPAENGTPDHCTHRDVHPIAGTTGFSADAWCPECGSYKTRRNPRKRPASSDDRYYY